MKFDYETVRSILDDFKGKKGSLIPVLQKTQEHFGFLPQEAMELVAEDLNISASEVYGVATFYKQFRFTPMGKNVIRVCHGTACHVSGSNILDATLENELKIKAGETTEDGLFTILPVACLGCCSLAPVVMINDKTYGNLTGTKLGKILDSYKNGKEGEL